MRITSAARTDVGRVREGNEDGFRDAAPFFAVADGMGGHRGGEVASRLALETAERLRDAGRDATLADLIREASRTVHARARTDRDVAGMGTTLTVAEVDGTVLRIAHVGDSRAYLLRDGALRQLTTDHTLVQRLVDIGEITPDEVADHPKRNVLVRVVGTEPDVEVDELEVPVRVGDRVLLCSDGLTGMVDDAHIAEVLRSTAGDAQAAVDRLVEAANAAGGADNVTALVVDLLVDPGDA